jgi:hypothetical protein
MRMRRLNFLIHYNKVEVYALIFAHILFNSTLGRKNGFIAAHPLLWFSNKLFTKLQSIITPLLNRTYFFVTF